MRLKRKDLDQDQTPILSNWTVLTLKVMLDIQKAPQPKPKNLTFYHHTSLYRFKTKSLTLNLTFKTPQTPSSNQIPSKLLSAITNHWLRAFKRYAPLPYSDHEKHINRKERLHTITFLAFSPFWALRQNPTFLKIPPQKRTWLLIKGPLKKSFARSHPQPHLTHLTLF